MGCILHDLHLQAGDDEEESGPHVSHVTGPEEAIMPDEAIVPDEAIMPLSESGHNKSF